MWMSERLEGGSALVPTRVFLLARKRVRAVSVLGWEAEKRGCRTAERVAAVAGAELTGPSSSATVADSVPHVILIRRPV